MSSPQTLAAAPRSPSRGQLIKLALGVLVPTGLVAAAVVPRRAALGLNPPPPMRLHAPQLWRVMEAPLTVQLHLAAVTLALGVGIVLLAGVKGTTAHRSLGWAWVAAMMTAAVSSLFIRQINNGHFSYIHLLSGWTILILPVAVSLARRRKVRAHGRAMTGIFTGGLILAGLFAFMPGRLMWRIVFG